MALVLPEAFTELEASQLAAAGAPLSHRFYVVIHVVVLLQPVSLALMFPQHLGFAPDLLRDVDDKVRTDFTAFPIQPFIGVTEIQVRNVLHRDGVAARGIIRYRRAEAGVANQHAGCLVIAVVIHGGCGDNDVGLHAAEEFGDAAPGWVIVIDGQVAELGTNVFRADELSGSFAFAASNAGDVFGTVLGAAAVARSHGADGHTMSAADQVHERACGEDLDIVRMRMNRKNVHWLKRIEYRAGKSE